jgi:hypothetical protein
MHVGPRGSVHAPVGPARSVHCHAAIPNPDPSTHSHAPAPAAGCGWAPGWTAPERSPPPRPAAAGCRGSRSGGTPPPPRTARRLRYKTATAQGWLLVRPSSARPCLDSQPGRVPALQRWHAQPDGGWTPRHAACQRRRSRPNAPFQSRFFRKATAPQPEPSTTMRVFFLGGAASMARAQLRGAPAGSGDGAACRAERLLQGRGARGAAQGLQKPRGEPRGTHAFALTLPTSCKFDLLLLQRLRGAVTVRSKRSLALRC